MNDHSRFLSIAASFSIGILIGIIIRASQIYQLQSEWISALSSIILTAITGIFVLQNRSILTEMMKARKAESLPNISANLGYPAPLSINLIIKNTGKGPAFEVDLNYGFEPIIQKQHVNWLQPLISPEEGYTFFLKPNNFKEASGLYDYLIVSGTCKDIFGQEHEIDEKIDLKENYKGYSAASMLYQDTIQRRLSGIANEVKQMGRDIKSSLEKITRNKRNFPLLIRIGDLEIRQPPLQDIHPSIHTIYFNGQSLDSEINTELQKLKEGDIEEIYCNDRHGEIYSGLCEIKKIELKEEDLEQKTIYYFNLNLEFHKPSTPS